jgi:hypothetical protein
MGTKPDASSDLAASASASSGNDDAGGASADAGPAPVTVEILSFLSPPSLTQHSFGWESSSTSSTPNDGFKFLVVEARLTHSPCTDALEHWGSDEARDAAAHFGLKASTDQAVLRLPDGRRLAARGGGGDYDHMCLGCTTMTQTSCGDGGAGTLRFWFVFITDDDLDPTTTTFEYRRVRAPLKQTHGDGGT